MVILGWYRGLIVVVITIVGGRNGWGATFDRLLGLELTLGCQR